MEYMTLRPCSFVEFINAKEGCQWADMLRNISVPDFMHEEMISAFNTYALIGGMPEAVSEYIDNQDVERLSPIFNSLLKGYNEDAEKFAKTTEQVRLLRHILATAWFSAAETITFSGFGNSKYTSTQIHDGMDLLERAYLLSLDYPVTATSAPALPQPRRSPKLIMVDTGLTNFYCRHTIGVSPEQESARHLAGQSFYLPNLYIAVKLTVRGIYIFTPSDVCFSARA